MFLCGGGDAFIIHQGRHEMIMLVMVMMVMIAMAAFKLMGQKWTFFKLQMEAHSRWDRPRQSFPKVWFLRVDSCLTSCLKGKVLKVGASPRCWSHTLPLLQAIASQINHHLFLPRFTSSSLSPCLSHLTSPALRTPPLSPVGLDHTQLLSQPSLTISSLFKTSPFFQSQRQCHLLQVFNTAHSSSQHLFLYPLLNTA